MSHFTTLININTDPQCFTEEEIYELMEPFCENTELNEYLEFNPAAETEADYNDATVECVHLANGKIVFLHDSAFSRKFTVENGLVYQKNFGPCMQK